MAPGLSANAARNSRALIAPDAATALAKLLPDAPRIAISSAIGPSLGDAPGQIEQIGRHGLLGHLRLSIPDGLLSELGERLMAMAQHE